MERQEKRGCWFLFDVETGRELPHSCYTKKKGEKRTERELERNEEEEHENCEEGASCFIHK
jgi:hypothetical protein